MSDDDRDLDIDSDEEGFGGSGGGGGGQDKRAHHNALVMSSNFNLKIFGNFLIMSRQLPSHHISDGH